MQHLSPICFLIRRVSGIQCTRRLFSSLFQHVQPLHNRNLCFKINLPSSLVYQQYSTQSGKVSQWFKNMLGLSGMSKSVSSFIKLMVSY